MTGRVFKQLYKKVFRRLHREGLLKYSERVLAILQGKGYGTASIKAEIGGIYRLLKNKDVSLCVDIGGNIGDYTAHLMKKFPKSKIYIFEPSQTNIKILSDRFSENNNIFVIPFAVSDSEGAATLFSNQVGSKMGSLTQRNLAHFDLKFDVKEDVETIRFEDFWVKELGSQPIDILKMDIEGHELSALKGCGAALEQVKVIQFEFGGCNVDTRTFFRDFWYFFCERGFDLYRITPFGVAPITAYSERDEFFSTTNYLAVRQ